MSKLHLAILKNDNLDTDEVCWEDACHERRDQVAFDVVDITSSTWLDHFQSSNYDGLLALPPNLSMPLKNLYDERVSILKVIKGLPVYPSLEEIIIYENKKYLSYWLEATGVPHPKTHVFYFIQEALIYIENCHFPVVGKKNIGASGRGVRILNSKEEARQYIKQTFSKKGAPKKVGPDWTKKGFLMRVVKKLLHPAELKEKLRKYSVENKDRQKDFIVLQEYVPHSFEWRCVRIGDSYFAHKKLIKSGKASGSLLKQYGAPPLSLLDFVKEITDLRGFWSQAVDVFEVEKDKYLVNEMQCIFGQSDPYQMLIDDVPGRYVNQGGNWIFEAGDFNKHESFLLRLDHFISILKNGNGKS